MLMKDAKSIIKHHEFYKINHISSQDKKKEQQIIFLKKKSKLMLSTHIRVAKSLSLMKKKVQQLNNSIKQNS